MQFNNDLEDETDFLAGEMQTLDNLPLEKFVFSDDQLPSIKLTRDKADNIDTDNFEQKQSQVLELMEKAKLDEKRMNDLQKQVIEAGKQNNFEKAFLD